MIKEFETMLREFHETFEHTCYPHPDNAPFEVHELRAKLIEEELKEYLMAATKVERLDAILDLIYVVVGTAITYSTPISQNDYEIAFYANHENSSSDLCRLTKCITMDLHTKFPCQNMLRKSINPVLSLLVALGDKASHGKTLLAFKSVHENNMAKLWNERPKDPALLVIQKRDKWLVKNRYGKTIKPPSHIPVDLTSYV